MGLNEKQKVESRKQKFNSNQKLPGEVEGPVKQGARLHGPKQTSRAKESSPVK
jgi:hypothetical protein